MRETIPGGHQSAAVAHAQQLMLLEIVRSVGAELLGGLSRREIDSTPGRP